MSKDKADHIHNLHILNKEGLLFCWARNRIWQQGKFRFLLHQSCAFNFLERSRFCYISGLSVRCQVPMFSLAQKKAWKLRCSQFHTKWIMSLGLWKEQLLCSLQAFAGSSHLLTTEQNVVWNGVLHPCSSTNPEKKFLLSVIKLVLFLEECLLTVGERNDDESTAYHTSVVSLFPWIQTALSSTVAWTPVTAERWVLIPCLCSISHNSHGLQLF